MEEQQKPYEFTYTNWQGITAKRRVIPMRTYWGTTEYHREPQWLMEAYDLDRQAPRTFAMSGILGDGVRR